MLSRNIKRARQAYRGRDVKALIAAHNANEGHAVHIGIGRYIKSMVYGGLDGVITTFAVVAGVAGASLGASVVLILGFANLIADGLSMAVGDYLSTKSEKEYQRAEREREEWEFDSFIAGEKKEMFEIYTSKGYSLEDAKKIVDLLAKDKKAFVDVMMREELGIFESEESPVKNALVTFSSFIFFGFMPLLTYVVSSVFNLVFNDFFIASGLTGVTLFFLGAVKYRITGRNWFRSGIEMLVVGGLAASAAYLVGALISTLI